MRGVWLRRWETRTLIRTVMGMYDGFANSSLTYGGVTKVKTILKVNNQKTDTYFDSLTYHL